MNETPRDGNWIDEWGSCKVCGGEIPHGHTNKCDIGKLEQELNEARQVAMKVSAERDQLRKVCDELASTIYVHSLRPQNALDTYNQLPHEENEMRTAEEIINASDSLCAEDVFEIQDIIDEAIAHGMTLSAEIIKERYGYADIEGGNKAILTARDNKVWREE